MMGEKPKLRQGKKPGDFQPSRFNSHSEDRKLSPLWLKGYEPDIMNEPNTFVGFAEYLHWMRSPDTNDKDKTKLQILEIAVEKSKSYRQRLKILTNRTKLIAGDNNTFNAKSTWRIRVGGQRGPESMLLPAWDALGIPYIPSSTLRGVAQDRAIREFIADGNNVSYDEAVKKIAPYFGSIETGTKSEDRSGKVIFLDAYPNPSNSEALAVDLANNIWRWNGDTPEYGAKPFPLISLLEPTFTIGIKPTSKCDLETFKRIKGWLIEGLQAGIGARVNSGYGELVIDRKTHPRKEILRASFFI